MNKQEFLIYMTNQHMASCQEQLLSDERYVKWAAAYDDHASSANKVRNKWAVNLLNFLDFCFLIALLVSPAIAMLVVNIMSNGNPYLFAGVLIVFVGFISFHFELISTPVFERMSRRKNES